jgi:hypothetical protein
MLPVPKIDIPTKMDSGSDGLGVLYFSRTIYVLSLATLVAYLVLIYSSTTIKNLGWLFIVAFLVGAIFATVYSLSVEQKN